MPTDPRLGEQVESLRDRLERWSDEVETATSRTTLNMGIAATACERFEKLIRIRLEVCSSETPRVVRNLIEVVAPGKRLQDLTLGQSVNILLTLDQAGKLRCGSRLLSETERRSLQRSVRIRNRLIHDSQPDEERLELTRSLLGELTLLLRGPLFR